MAVITLVLTNSFTGTGTVDFATSDGTAIAGVDYLTTTGMVTFLPGSTGATVNLTLLSDPSPDPNETVNLVLNNPTGPIAIGASPNAVLNILAPGATVAFRQPTYSVAEAASNVIITLVLSGNIGATGIVDYAVSEGTAIDGVDFTATNSTLVFVPGQLTNTFSVEMLGDPSIDENETVDLLLSNPTGSLSLGSPSSAVLTLLDQNSPELEFSAPGYRILRHAGSATVVVVRLGDTSGAASVSYDTTDGTATNGVDYLGTNGQMNFDPGQVSNSFSFVVVNPDLVESNQTVNLTLSDPNRANLGSQSTAVVNVVSHQRQTLTLTDDDGDRATLTFRPPGTMAVSQDGSDVKILLSQTDASSSLVVKVKKLAEGDGLVKIGSIQSGGGCRRIDAPDADVDGDGVSLTNGYLGTLRIHDLLNGAMVLAGGMTNQHTRIRVHDIPDGTIISVGDRLTTFRAARLSGGEIDAAKIGTISVVGDRRTGIPGVIEDTLISITNPDIAMTNGTIGAITASQMIDSSVYAGFTPELETNPLGGGTFVPDLIIRSVNLHSVTISNDGQPFGVLADENISSVTVKNPPFKWCRSGPNDQSLGDFHVEH